VRVQGGTRRHRRKRRRGSGDGARGQQRVVVGMDGWDGSGVFTHIVLCIHHCTQLHQRVDQRQSPIEGCVVQQSCIALPTHTHTHIHTRERVRGEREGCCSRVPHPQDTTVDLEHHGHVQLGDDVRVAVSLDCPLGGGKLRTAHTRKYQTATRHVGGGGGGGGDNDGGVMMMMMMMMIAKEKEKEKER